MSIVSGLYDMPAGSDPADDDGLEITGLFTAVGTSAGAEITPFAMVGLSAASDTPITVTVTLSDPTVAALDIPAFDAAEQSNPDIGYGYSSTFSGLYDELDIAGDATAVLAALRTVAIAPVASDRTVTAGETVELVVTDGSAQASAEIGLSVTPTPTPGYVSNTGSDLTGTVFTVSDDPTLFAGIDLSANHQNKVVFGGSAGLALITDNAVIVLNGPSQTGPVLISSLGGNTVWAGSASIDYESGGASRLILGDEPATSSTLTIQDGASPGTNEIDIWGDASETQTVSIAGASANTLFAGRSNLSFTGGNTVIVANGAEATGNVVINSDGGNVVWAGTARLLFNEGGGSDQILLTGGARTTVDGANGVTGGTTTLQDLGNTGALIYEGGARTAALDLAGGQTTVFGGAGAQTMTLDGSGSLVVADAVTSTGVQSITVGAASTGPFAFWGGGNAAAITLGGGASFIQAGAGNTSLVGGSGAATIDLSRSGTVSLAIDGAHGGVTDVFGFSPARATAVIQDVAAFSVASGNLLVSLGDGATVTFHGVTDPTHAGIIFG